MTIHQITLNGKSFVARRGELLLDAALSNGIDLPYDCRAGHCGTCCVRLVSGEVRGGEGSEPGIVHACQCRIAGDAVIERDQASGVRTVEGVLSIAPPVARGDGGWHQDGPRAALSCGTICAGALQRLSEPSLQHHSSLARQSEQPLGLVPCPAHGGWACHLIARQAHQAGPSGEADRALWLGAFPAQSDGPADLCRHQHRLCADLVDRRRCTARRTRSAK